MGAIGLDFVSTTDASDPIFGIVCHEVTSHDAGLSATSWFRAFNVIRRLIP
jgi:hypothetical protein